MATVNSVVENEGIFKIDYSLTTNKGWSDDIGKLNEDYQVTPDNDYYQNLSYSIKSPIEFEDWVNPVNRVIHSSGLKNFADTGITSTAKVSTAQTATSSSDALLDIINVSDNGEVMRVDTINFFDFGIDVDVDNNKSKFVKFQTKKLSDYIECKTNRVLTIDNFNNLFSNQENANTTPYKDIDTFISNDGFSRYFVQIIKPDGTEAQATELIVINTPDDELITVERASSYTTDEELASMEAITDSFGNSSLRLTPTDQFDKDLDVKFIKDNFNTTLAGIGTQSIGFVNLIGGNVSVSTASTSTIYASPTDKLESIFATIEVTDKTTKDKTVVDMFVDHNGTAITAEADFFFDNSPRIGASNNFIGTFISSIESGVLKLDFENTSEENDVLVRSRVVGFGTTTAGIGTHVFKASGQPDDSVREGRLESSFAKIPGTGISTIRTYDLSDVTTVKSTARVSYGNTTALHQVLYNHDKSDAFSMQYPFLSANDVIGIGTFGADIDGIEFKLIFHPDANINEEITVQLYSEVIQTEKDLNNVPAVLNYGTINERLKTSQYDAVNGDRTNIFDFDVKHNEIPIFEKQFNPADSTVVDLATGTFNIADHFFRSGEKLIYTPRSTFVNAGFGSMIMTGGDPLPPDVFAIRVNKDQFRVSLTSGGSAITFSGDGDGNGHTFEMEKKLEKSLISIDGLTRAPLAFSPISHTIDNEANVSVTDTYIGLSGISSILPGDVMKIDNEFVKVDAVGLGTTTAGPISGGGSVNLIKLERGFVGTAASTHTDGSTIRLFRGSYNMTRSKIHFTEAPRGNAAEVVDESNIPYFKSKFQW